MDPTRVAMYVDGVQWWEAADPAHLPPPGPMHLCIQLDNFGANLSDGASITVDWARQYPL